MIRSGSRPAVLPPGRGYSPSRGAALAVLGRVGGRTSARHVVERHVCLPGRQARPNGAGSLLGRWRSAGRFIEDVLGDEQVKDADSARNMVELAADARSTAHAGQARAFRRGRHWARPAATQARSPAGPGSGFFWCSFGFAWITRARTLAGLSGLRIGDASLPRSRQLVVHRRSHCAPGVA